MGVGVVWLLRSKQRHLDGPILLQLEPGNEHEMNNLRP
jgi:hypothetical protein